MESFYTEEFKENTFPTWTRVLLHGWVRSKLCWSQWRDSLDLGGSGSAPAFPQGWLSQAWLLDRAKENLLLSRAALFP